MSLRPIDMQIAVQRSGDVLQKLNSNAAHRPEFVHQQFAERLQREVEHNNNHVRQSNKSEEEQTIKRDGRRHSNGSESERERKEKEKAKKRAALTALMGGNIIDIRV